MRHGALDQPLRWRGTRGAEHLVPRSEVNDWRAAASAAYLHSMCGRADFLFSLAVTERALGPVAKAIPVRMHIAPGSAFSDIGAAVEAEVPCVLRHSLHQNADIRLAAGLPESVDNGFGVLLNLVAGTESLDFDGRPACFADVRLISIDEGLIALVRAVAGDPQVLVEAIDVVFSDEAVQPGAELLS
jgi:hypothetical protein